MRGRISLFLDISVLLLNFIACFLLVLSYLAPHANPQYLSFIAIFGFSYPVLLAVTCLFIVYWLFRPFKGHIALLSVICVSLGSGIFTRYFGFHMATPANIKQHDAIRIMQYNIRAFGIFEYRWDSTEHNLYKLIGTKQPDIITFEEYFVRNFEQGAVTKQLTKAFGSPYHYFKAFDLTHTDSAGNAIFSKYPIVNSGFIAGDKLHPNETIFVDINKGGRIFRVYNVHLAPVVMTDEEKAKYLEGNISPAQAFFIYNRLAEAFKLRSHEVKQVGAHMDRCPYPIILTGDFNDTPISYSVNTLGSGLQNAFTHQGSGFLTTFYSKYPLLIDYIFAGPQFEILNFETIDNHLSDHKPIISDVRFRRS